MSGSLRRVRDGYDPLVLAAALIGVVAVATTWLVLAVLAARLPPGLARDVVDFLPACVTLLVRLRRDPRVPASAKVALVPGNALVAVDDRRDPGVRPRDRTGYDALVVALALRWASRRVPRALLHEAWPGDPWLLDRLLGAAR
jgi:hypothetical protein